MTTFFHFSLALCVCCLLTVSTSAAEPKPELLWPNGAPGAVGDEPADKPTLTFFPAPEATANGAAVIVCPGGGYGGLAGAYEGEDVARWFNTQGVTGVVLRYRTAPRYGHPAPLQDAQRAIRTVRSRAKKLNIEPSRIGILGFSAGGHLTSSAATHYDDGNPQATDPIERVGCRPDFAVLCYAVVSLTEPFTHVGSRRNLLGENPPAELVLSLSSEKQVTSKTPPCFIWHTTNDQSVPAENAIAFYLACKKQGVPVEMHIYEKGVHGIGLGKPDHAASSWPERCAAWLKERGFFTRK